METEICRKNGWEHVDICSRSEKKTDTDPQTTFPDEDPN